MMSLDWSIVADEEDREMRERADEKERSDPVVVYEDSGRSGDVGSKIRVTWKIPHLVRNEERESR
jgi:hypothetical protein